MTYNLESISTKLIDIITDLLDEFEIKYAVYNNRISFPCPVHGGDNPEGSSIFTKGIGNWQCFTHQCHSNYGNSSGASIIQFVQALLNSDFFTALQWCANFVGEESDTSTKKIDVNKLNFVKICESFKLEKPTFKVIHDRELLPKMLTIPSSYYIGRGYSKEVLNKFSVGYCYREKHPMFNRVVVPLFNDDGQYVVGYIGRNIYEKCDQCGYCHKNGVRCPIDKDEKNSCAKWKCTYQFSSDDYLYNYWNAKPHILRTNTVVLVEGTGDVWRLEEASIYNSLAVLGAKFSKTQQNILDTLGVINIVVATDNDDAGNKIAKIIYDNCKQSFNIIRFISSKKDIGDTTIEELKMKLLPIIERASL